MVTKAELSKKQQLQELSTLRKKYLTDKIDLRQIMEAKIEKDLEDTKNAYERLIVELRARRDPATVSDIGKAMGTKDRRTVYDILSRMKPIIDMELSTLPEESSIYSWVRDAEYVTYDISSGEGTYPWESYGTTVMLNQFVETPHVREGYSLRVNYVEYGPKFVTEHQIYALTKYSAEYEGRGYKFKALLPLQRPDLTNPTVEPKVINTRRLEDEDNQWEIPNAPKFVLQNKRRFYINDALEWVRENPMPEVNDEGGF